MRTYEGVNDNILFALPIILVTIDGVDTLCLFDTGSVKSLLSAETYFGENPRRQIGPIDINFRAVNGSKIVSYGRTKVNVIIAKMTFPATMYVSEIAGNLLGIYFMTEHKLTFNIENKEMNLSHGLGGLNIYDTTIPLYTTVINAINTVPNMSSKLYGAMSNKRNDEVWRLNQKQG